MNLTPEMLHTMIASVIAFTALYAALLTFRADIMTRQEALKEATLIEEEA